MPDEFILVSFLAGMFTLVYLILNRYSDPMVRFFPSSLGYP